MSSRHSRSRGATPVLRAVLVDIDGTLVDSNDAHTRAWMSAFKRHGHVFSFETIRPLIGMGGDKMLLELLGISDDSEEGQGLNSARAEFFSRDELQRLQPTRGARGLLERIKADGLKLIVATSAKSDEANALLKQAGIDDLVDDQADSTMARQSKPDPDIVEAALRQAGLRPSEAIMLGDTPYDVQAASKAGVATIALRCGGWWNDDVFSAAVGTYDDPADLFASYDDGPLGRAR